MATNSVAAPGSGVLYGRLGLLFGTLVLVLVLHGAIPFVGLPTLGQAVALLGFSQSFSEAGLWSLYSSHFGRPSDAPLAMGMPVALPSGVLISLGLHPADAYSLVTASWLSVALIGAFSFARELGSSFLLSVIAAALWSSNPLTWAHADYSSLAVGLALLPTYLFAAMKVHLAPSPAGIRALGWAGVYVALSVIALFMDGYSFMMFAVGSSAVGAYGVLAANGGHVARAGWVAIVQIVALGVAYGSYTSYVGVSEYEPASLDFFRGWGLDVSFLLVPTQGVFWIWDLLGVSMPRSRELFFGDASVWNTTFALPLIISATVALATIRRSGILTGTFLVIAIFGFYMAMGPSVKIDATKPFPMGDLMPAEYAGASTGSAIISEHFPGFKNMRASYRWSGLGQVGLWAVIILAAANVRSRKAARSWAALLVVLLITQLPDFSVKHRGYVANRVSLFQMEHDLVPVLSGDLRSSEMVAFLPFRNDFLVNYLAPKLGVRTFNIGGDKQLKAAREFWPATMRGFAFGRVDDDFADRVILLLVRGEADAVVLPYVDLLWAAHQWPYPVEFKDNLAPAVARLSMAEFVEIQEREYYAVVRLRADLAGRAGDDVLEAEVAVDLCMPPECLRRNGFSSVISQVAFVDGRTLRSTGMAGFLLYGPYVHMNAGCYYLTITGTQYSGSTAWVDVVSSGGTIQHLRLEVLPGSEEQHENLVEGSFFLSGPVDDLEVRIFVEKEDVVEVQGFEMHPKKPCSADALRLCSDGRDRSDVYQKLQVTQ